MTLVMPIYLCSLELRLRRSKYLAMALLSHRQGWSWAVLLLCFSAASFAIDPSDSTRQTYRTGASEVRVTFFATDERNRPVDNLTSNDFAVVDNGLIVRDFRSLTRAEETALNISLLLDTSESVAPRFGETRDGVLHLLAQKSASPGEGLSLITFSGLHPALVCSTDCQNAAAEQRVLALNPGGATPLFDALRYTAQLISQRHAAGMREVLILFSDGNDTVSMASAREALEAISATEAILYVIEPAATARASNRNFVLEQMAEATGGRPFPLEQGTTSALQRVLSDLRASYVVTYKLPNRLVGFHSLRILPKHNLNLQFHCRRGYTYDEAR